MPKVFHCEQDLLVNLIVLSPKLARRQFRKHIFESWDWKCAYCGKELTPDTATIDHILPKHKGGHNVRSNMGSSLVEDWYTEQQLFYTKERFDKIMIWLEQKPYSIKLPSTEGAQPYIDNDSYISWIAS